MNFRVIIAVLFLLSVPFHAEEAKKKRPLALEVSKKATGLPLVTLTASDEPLGEVAERLAKALGTTIDVSEAARNLKVTTALDEQPLDLMLRELTAQAYLDGILSGGSSAKLTILAIHLRTAGEPAPSLAELKKSSSETIMFFGNTEDPTLDAFDGKLEVAYRNDRLRVFARKQPLSVVAARLADVLGIPFQLIGDSREVIDVSVTDATPEQAIAALPDSVKLYLRKDLATFRTMPQRLVLQEPFTPTPTP
jgi:hypothetical protein